MLTPEYVNSAPALDLHQFAWTDDALIGDLPREWNHLVGDSPPNPAAKNVHWTIGGPYFNEYKDVEFSNEWWVEYEATTYCAQRKDL